MRIYMGIHYETVIYNCDYCGHIVTSLSGVNSHIKKHRCLEYNMNTLSLENPVFSKVLRKNLFTFIINFYFPFCQWFFGVF